MNEKSEVEKWKDLSAVHAEISIMYEGEGTPVTNPKHRTQMLQSSDSGRWKESERAEMESNTKNQTIRMADLSRDELESQCYEIIT